MALGCCAAMAGQRSDALDEAFKFASAITADSSDQSKAQAAVVDDMAESGALEEAALKAEEIAGWRRGTAYAGLAARFALEGNSTRAHELLSRAKEVQNRTSGWQQKRIEALIAAAEASLGELGAPVQGMETLAAHDSQYEGLAETASAVSLARKGKLDEALERLSRLDTSRGLEAGISRTRGYLEIGRQVSLPVEKRLVVLRKARASADGMGGHSRLDGLVRVAEAQLALGATVEAKDTLQLTAPAIDSIPPTMPVKAQIQSAAASAWAGVGDRKRARLLLQNLVRDIPSAGVLDQAPAYANAASVYVVLGEPGRAAELFEQSLSAAQTMVNARPRALAVVEICRAMGRAQWALDAATRSRLEALLAGLKDPW